MVYELLSARLLHGGENAMDRQWQGNCPVLLVRALLLPLIKVLVRSVGGLEPLSMWKLGVQTMT